MMNYHYNVYKELAEARMKDLQKITFEQKRYAKVKRMSPVKKKVRSMFRKIKFSGSRSKLAVHKTPPCND